MRIDFTEFCDTVATTRGGFTLWIGAGAAIALTRGRTPSWRNLVERIAREHSVQVPEMQSLPAMLEALSNRVGHVLVRQSLRRHLVDGVLAGQVDQDVAASQSLIGARAAALVSFNVEEFSSLPFLALKGGGSMVVRTFRERSPLGLEVHSETAPGAVAPPVYFPHGLLNHGNLVMTKSEYDRFFGTMAVATAVHLCVGGDLVILGMSLDDEYLRKALTDNRRWLGRIYWLGQTCQYPEWARTAQVNFVAVKHERLWYEFGEAICTGAARPKLRADADDVRANIHKWMQDVVSSHMRLPRALQLHAERLLTQHPALPSEKITEFAERCIDMGFDVPDPIRQDPRCRIDQQPCRGGIGQRP